MYISPAKDGQVLRTTEKIISDSDRSEFATSNPLQFSKGAQIDGMVGQARFVWSSDGIQNPRCKAHTNRPAERLQKLKKLKEPRGVSWRSEFLWKSMSRIEITANFWINRALPLCHNISLFTSCHWDGIGSSVSHINTPGFTVVPKAYFPGSIRIDQTEPRCPFFRRPHKRLFNFQP